MIDGQKRSFMKFQDVRAFLDSVLDEDIHTKRVDSLANATLGVMTGASLGVALIGKSLAQARGLLPKHAIKQVEVAFLQLVLRKAVQINGRPYHARSHEHSTQNENPLC